MGGMTGEPEDCCARKTNSEPQSICVNDWLNWTLNMELHRTLELFYNQVKLKSCCTCRWTFRLDALLSYCATTEAWCKLCWHRRLEQRNIRELVALGDTSTYLQSICHNTKTMTKIPVAEVQILLCIWRKVVLNPPVQWIAASPAPTHLLLVAG